MGLEAYMSLWAVYGRLGWIWVWLCKQCELCSVYLYLVFPSSSFFLVHEIKSQPHITTQKVPYHLVSEHLDPYGT